GFPNLFASEDGWAIALSTRQAFVWHFSDIPLPRRTAIVTAPPNGIAGYHSAWRTALFGGSNRWLALLQKGTGGDQLALFKLTSHGPQRSTITRTTDDRLGNLLFSPDANWLLTW